MKSTPTRSLSAERPLWIFATLWSLRQYPTKAREWSWAKKFSLIQSAGFDGIFAPPQTPKPIIDRIYQSVNKALANPELSKKFGDEGFDIVAVPPDRFERSFKQEIVYWQKFAKDNNLKID